MKMARAFAASVPLALLLVAAFLVPVALIPGAFGFHAWPKSRAAPPHIDAVVLAAPAAERPRAVVLTARAPARTARPRAALPEPRRSLPAARPQASRPRTADTHAAPPARQPAPQAVSHSTPVQPHQVASAAPASPAQQPAAAPGSEPRVSEPAPVHEARNVVEQVAGAGIDLTQAAAKDSAAGDSSPRAPLRSALGDGTN